MKKLLNSPLLIVKHPDGTTVEVKPIPLWRLGTKGISALKFWENVQKFLDDPLWKEMEKEEKKGGENNESRGPCSLL